MPPKGSGGGTSVEEWVGRLVAAKDKDGDLESILKPRMELLMDPKFNRPEQHGNTIAGLQDAARRCPSIFSRPPVLRLLLDILRVVFGPAPRDGHFQQNLAVELLWAAYQDAELWPTGLVGVFLSDAMDKRSWVDSAGSFSLVANIVTAFPASSCLPPAAVPKTLARPGQPGGGEPDPKRRKTEQPSPKLGSQAAPRAGDGALFEEEEMLAGGGGDEDMGGGVVKDKDKEKEKEKDKGDRDSGGVGVRPRFRTEKAQAEIAGLVAEAVRTQIEAAGDLLERKAKSVLRVLPLLMGYEKVRHCVALRIESWVNNASIMRFTRELLPRLAVECALDTETEQETMKKVIQMRPKAHAVKEQIEAIASLARTNVHFCHIALLHVLREETGNVEAVTANKSLKLKQHCEALFRASGTAHLYADRATSRGAGRERLLVADAGVGPAVFHANGVLKLFAATNGGAAAAGAIVVATESEVCGGRTGVEGAEFVSSMGVCAAALMRLGAVGLVVVQSGAARPSGKSWNTAPSPLGPMVPVVIAPSGEAAAAAVAAATDGLVGQIVRTPLERELAFQLKRLADLPEPRKCMTSLVRKLLKLGDLDPVALCLELMEPEPQMLAEEETKRREWGLCLVDTVCFVCIFLAWQAQETAAPSMHAERAAAAGESRAAKAMATLRSQIARIQEGAMRWCFIQLPPTIGDRALAEAVRKLVFREKAHTYNRQHDPLDSAERGAISTHLLNDIPVTAEALVWVARLGLPVQPQQLPGAAPGDPFGRAACLPRWDALDTIDVLVARAVALESKRVARGGATDGGRGHAAAAHEELDVANLAVSKLEDAAVLIESVFKLSQFPREEVGALSPAKRYWQACLATVHLACFNPATVGAVLWEHHPTVKSLLLSLIMGVSSFPPIPGLPPQSGAPQQQHDTTDVAEGAQQALAAADARAVEGAKRVAAALPISDQDKMVLLVQLENAVLTDPSSPARRPPPEVYDRLRGAEAESSLGHVLRMSRTPDLLLEAIRLHGPDSAKCVGWLTPILERYPTTVDALPELTISRMLLADISHQVTADLSAPQPPADRPNGGGGSATEARRRPHKGELHRMVARLAGPLAKGEAGCNAPLELFASLLQNPSSETRASAVRGLELLAAEAAGGGVEGGEGAAGGGWLEQLAGLPSFDSLRGGLVATLREALAVETEVPLVRGYVEGLGGCLGMDARELALEVSHVLLRRGIFAEHLARHAGAMGAVTKALEAGCDASMSYTEMAKKEGEDLVRCGGGGLTLPRSLARAVVHAACLASRGPCSGEAVGLFDLVVASAEDAAGVGLEGADMARMFRCAEERVFARAVAVADEGALRGAIGLFGPSPECLLAVCRKLRGLLGAKGGGGGEAPRGLRRVAAALREKDGELAAWLEGAWPAPPTPVGGRAGGGGGLVRRVRAPLGGGDAAMADAAVGVGVEAPAGGGDREMASDGGGGGSAPPAEGDLLKMAEEGGLLRLEGGVKAAVSAIQSPAGTEGGGRGADALVAELERVSLADAGARGLCADLLSVASPVIASGGGGRGGGDNGGDAVLRAFWERPQPCVLGSLVRWGSRGAVEACAGWLLAAELDAEAGCMVRDGVRVPCGPALDAVSSWVLGSAGGGCEGYWDEGGGSDVNETLTWREHCASGSVRRALTEAQCVSLALYIVCEAAGSAEGAAHQQQRGSVRMGRMQLLLEAVGGGGGGGAAAVGEALQGVLASMARGGGGCVVEGGGKGEGMVSGAWELLERLKLALPMALSNVTPPPIEELLPGEAAAHHAMVRQTSRLDRLLQLVLTSLQDSDERASSAIVVARQIAGAHPRLIATHMLSLRALCAGKSLVRLSDLVARNAPRLLSYVVSILLAARPHSLSSPGLPSLLDELLLVYAATVRYEAPLEPLLGKVSTLLRHYAAHSARGAAYVEAYAPLLQSLAGWYPESAELQALLEQALPGALVHNLGFGGESAASRLVGTLSGKLRALRGASGGGLGREEAPGAGGGDEALLEVLDEVDLSCKGASGAELLLLLERPLMDLLSAPSPRVRDAAYRLALRLAVQRPEAAPRVAERLLVCLESSDEGTAASATRNSPELVHLSAETAPRILAVLFRLARGGSHTACEELLRATRSGLKYAIIQNK